MRRPNWHKETTQRHPQQQQGCTGTSAVIIGAVLGLFWGIILLAFVVRALTGETRVEVAIIALVMYGALGPPLPYFLIRYGLGKASPGNTGWHYRR